MSQEFNEASLMKWIRILSMEFSWNFFRKKFYKTFTKWISWKGTNLETLAILCNCFTLFILLRYTRRFKEFRLSNISHKYISLIENVVRQNIWSVYGHPLTEYCESVDVTPMQEIRLEILNRGQMRSLFIRYLLLWK